MGNMPAEVKSGLWVWVIGTLVFITVGILKISGYVHTSIETLCVVWITSMFMVFVIAGSCHTALRELDKQEKSGWTNDPEELTARRSALTGIAIALVILLLIVALAGLFAYLVLTAF